MVKVTETVDVLEFVELAVCVLELVEVVDSVLLLDTEAEKEFPVVALYELDALVVTVSFSLNV